MGGAGDGGSEDRSTTYGLVRALGSGPLPGETLKQAVETGRALHSEAPPQPRAWRREPSHAQWPETTPQLYGQPHQSPESLARTPATPAVPAIKPQPTDVVSMSPMVPCTATWLRHAAENPWFLWRRLLLGHTLAAGPAGRVRLPSQWETSTTPAGDAPARLRQPCAVRPISAPDLRCLHPGVVAGPPSAQRCRRGS